MTRIYSLDPVQNAELAAEHAAEARITGVSVSTYWGEDCSPRDHDGQWGDEYGDIGWDEIEEEEVGYWEDRLPGLIFAITHGTTEAKAKAWNEIMGMAQEADAFRNEER